MEKLIKADEDYLTGIREIGPEVARSIVQFFKQEVNIQTINRLKKAGVSFIPTSVENKKNLEDMIFVFTGGLEKYTREEAKRLVENQGGKISSSISSKTQFLVAGDSPGSKLKKAKELEVKIISEKEFYDIVKSEEK
jgi:DNA ligase (NAD+)